MSKFSSKMLLNGISIFLVFALVLGLAACSNTTKGSNTGEKKPEDDSKLLKAYDKATPSGYPVVKETLTLKCWKPFASNAAKYISSFAENEAYMEAEKKTGIKIEFIHPAINQENEQFNLMIASMDLPDIINGTGRYKGGVSKGVDDGVFMDMGPYMSRYAPDYYKLVRSDPDMYRQVAFEDGRIGAFYQVKPKEQTDPPHNGVIIRKDWLDELGLPVPKTIDQWYTTLKAFKDKKKIEAPLLLNPSGISESGAFITAFDLAPIDFYLRDGKVVDSPKIQSKYKDYLTLLNKWYAEGLIAKDFPTLKGAQHNQLLTSNRMGAGTVFAIGTAVILTEPLNIDITIAPTPRLKENDAIHFRYPTWPATGEETVVTAASKYPAEAMRWLNYGYTAEGALLFNFGVEGKSWVKGPDGKPQVTDYMLKNPKYDLESVNNILRVHFMPKYTYADLVCNPGIVASTKAANFRREWGKEKYDDIYAIPPMKLSLEDSNRRAQIMTDVNAYINEMTLKFIVGTEPLSRFDEYVKQVKNLNIDEAIKITQQGYDNYMKLNIK